LLATLKPALGGLQTGWQLSAIVDWRRSVWSARGASEAKPKPALARILAGAVIAGSRQTSMGIGPSVGDSELCLTVWASKCPISTLQINEAFVSEVIGVRRG